MFAGVVAVLISCTSTAAPVPVGTPVEPAARNGGEEVIEEPEALNHQPHVVSLSFTQDEYIYSDRIGVEYETLRS